MSNSNGGGYGSSLCLPLPSLCQLVGLAALVAVVAAAAVAISMLLMGKKRRRRRSIGDADDTNDPDDEVHARTVIEVLVFKGIYL